MDIKHRRSLIIHFPCFSELTEQELLQFANLWEEAHYSAGDVIVSEGDVIDSIYIIAEGTSEVTIGGKNQSQPIAVLRMGESIGLNGSGFFSKTGFRTATVAAQTDMRLLRLSISSFHQFSEKHPHIHDSILKTVKQTLRLSLIKEAMPFLQLTQDQVKWLSQRIEEKKFLEGELIFLAGEEGKHCYLILSGKVEIFDKDKEGHKQIFAQLEKPQVLGEVALITSSPRNASARATEPTSVLVLHKTDFLELLQQSSETLASLTSYMVERFRPCKNKQVVVYQRQTSDGNVIITLKDLTKNSYFQLSAEGLFIYEHLNGNTSLQHVMNMMKKQFGRSSPEFISKLVADLVQGGFVFYTKEEQLNVPRLTVISYDTAGFSEAVGSHFEECFPIAGDKKITWVHLEGLQDVGLVNKLTQQYQLHELTVEDILNTAQQRPKVEIFDHYIFLSFKIPTLNKIKNQITTENLSFVLGKDFVLSFQKNEGELFDMIKSHLTTNKGQYIRERGADFLVYELLHALLDRYFDVLGEIGNKMDTLEIAVLKTSKTNFNGPIYRLKRYVFDLRKTIWPMREAVNNLLHHVDNQLISATYVMYLRDLYGRVAQAADTIDTYRDVISGMLDAYRSALSMRMNEVIKVLTIISTIFIPTSFIASLYGMNFVHMPELYWPWGFRMAEGVMLLIAIVMILFFKKKKWF